MRNQKAFASLLGAVEKMKAGTQGNSDDQNFWKLEGDKAGNGRATIRFLPAKDDDSAPFVKTFSHGFQSDSGKWFIEQCPTTIGQNCPVCEANGPLWNSGRESDKEIVRKRKRKVSYVANVLVVEDPANPDNEGKVFLWKFGQKIFDKIVDKIKPQFDDEQPMNPFDAVEGANFKLKMRRVEGYANFDKSEFGEVEAIGNDKEIAKIVEQLHDLGKFVDPKSFKSYDDLQTRFESVVNGRTGGVAKKAKVEDDEDDSDSAFAKKAAAKAKKDDDEDEPPWEGKDTLKGKKAAASDDDDEDLEFFKKLAEAD
jgi:gp32 DNA binding protein like